MNTPSISTQIEAFATMVPFGPALPDGTTIEVAQDFGAYPAEYAAIRQRVGIMHLPQRGILELRGADVKDFLHRLMTQDINGMTGGQSRRAFQLNHKGRIVADTVVHHGDTATWLETDVFDIPALTELLESKLFSEDVTLEDFSAKRECLAVIGPASMALLSAIASEAEAVQRAADMPGTHHVIELAGGLTTVSRRDDCGVMGFRLFAPPDRAAALYEVLLATAGYEQESEAQPDAEYAERRRQSLRGRPIGWSAYNTARIEAGSPLFHIDFGPDSLPAETALLDEAVSFTTGCYLGQEIVARMNSLGHPKRLVVGIRFEGDTLPIAGTQVIAPPSETPEETPDAASESSPLKPQTSSLAPIGGITSSTISPLLGNQAIALAVMKWGFHRLKTQVGVFSEGKFVCGQIQSLNCMDA